MPLDIAFVLGLGLILGSFLNALLFRFNTGKTVFLGRSACMRCGHALRAIDLIPVASFLLLRGRCRYCRAKISWQYPAVEGLAGLMAVLVYLQTGPTPWFVFWCVAWLVLLFIVVYDLRHSIIPWSASLPLMALGLVHACAFGTWWGVALGAPLLLLSLFSGGRWMGWGDGFLELGLGALLGGTAGLTALMLAFWTGAVVGIALMWARKSVTMKTEVPFAPFLIFGAAVAYFLHVDLFSSITLLF